MLRGGFPENQVYKPLSDVGIARQNCSVRREVSRQVDTNCSTANRFKVAMRAAGKNGPYGFVRPMIRKFDLVRSATVLSFKIDLLTALTQSK